MSEVLKVKNNPLSKKSVTMLIVALVVVSFLVGSLYAKMQMLEKGTTTTGIQADADGDAASTDVANGQSKSAENIDIKDVDTTGEPFIGQENAPVVLAYWFDFQCPFCKRFEADTLPALIERYVNTGKLKIVFKDFQFLGPDSQTAGLAEHAVWESSPQNYFKWHEAMFEKQDSENSEWGNKDDIAALIKTIPGIDANKVSQLMDSNKEAYQKEQDNDKAEGSKYNIKGTPGFVIGTQTISGAQPINVFTQIIDAKLAK